MVFGNRKWIGTILLLMTASGFCQGQTRAANEVQPPKILNPAAPRYPEAARALGTVRLTAIIGTDGTVRDLKVISGPPELTNAAAAAVKETTFEPALQAGKRATAQVMVDVDFRTKTFTFVFPSPGRLETTDFVHFP